MAGPHMELGTLGPPPGLHLSPDISSSALSNPSHSFPSLQKDGQLQSSGPDTLFLESLQTRVRLPSKKDAGVTDRCLGLPPAEPMGSISKGVEAMPLSEGSLASAPSAFHGSARVVAVGVKYHWKPPRCASCKKSGHTVAQCKARTIFKPIKVSKSVSAMDVAPGGPLEDEIGKRLLAEGYNTAPSAGKPLGSHEDEIDAPGEIRKLENMEAPSPNGCRVSTIMQNVPGDCNSLSLLQKSFRKDLPASQSASPGILTLVGALDERSCLSSKATIDADSSQLLKAENSGLDLETSAVNLEPIEAPSVEACISSGVGMNLAVAEGSVLDVYDSVNSFAILQDPEDLDVQKLQCGPPIELTCNAPVLIPGSASDNKPLEQKVTNSKAEILVNLELFFLPLCANDGAAIAGGGSDDLMPVIWLADAELLGLSSFKPSQLSVFLGCADAAGNSAGVGSGLCSRCRMLGLLNAGSSAVNPWLSGDIVSAIKVATATDATCWSATDTVDGG
ncbi:hypothetical protein Nepgr_014776 [Nepenthes gracilis]|uniref:Uncharacterized protein n=1 Tax=Nepenthes gracilis TaxID=150966 RepID=A0AAD3SJW2_NEPGR|nr:hypothetical protein Nepgr_014776 [Nepenthes gracilis]